MAPRVLLNEIQPFDRHEQLVVAGVAELEKLLRGVGDTDLLETDEHSDAVIDVDDQVADLQVAQVREKSLAGRSSALRRTALFLEDVGFGVDVQSGVGQPEAAREMADRDQDRCVTRVLGPLHGHGEQVVLFQQLDRPFGPAWRRGDEQRRFAFAAKPPNLRHPIRHAAVHLHARLTSNVERRKSAHRQGRRPRPGR